MTDINVLNWSPDTQVILHVNHNQAAKMPLKQAATFLNVFGGHAEIRDLYGRTLVQALEADVLVTALAEYNAKA